MLLPSGLSCLACYPVSRGSGLYLMEWSLHPFYQPEGEQWLTALPLVQRSTEDALQKGDTRWWT